MALAAAGPISPQPAPGAPAKAPQAQPAATAVALKDDKGSLRTLVADAVGNGPRGTDPAKASSSGLHAGAVLAMGFSSSPMGDLTTNRFTGPAVKPLVTR